MTSVSSPFDQNAFIQLLVPLDNVDSTIDQEADKPGSVRIVKGDLLAALLGKAESLIAQAGHGDMDTVLLLTEEIPGQTQSPQSQASSADDENVALTCRWHSTRLGSGCVTKNVGVYLRGPSAR